MTEQPHSAPEPPAPEDSSPGTTADPASADGAPGRAGRRFRWVGWCGWLCLLVAVAGLVWIGVTALLARSRLDSARTEVAQVRAALLAGDVSSAAASMRAAQDDASAAKWLVSGPAWWVGAHLPYVGRPLETSRAISTAADTVGRSVLPGIVRLGQTIKGDSLRSGASVDLAPLISARPVVDAAARSAVDAIAEARASPSHSWLSSIDANRRSVVDQLVSLRGDLSGASRALNLAVPMLGEKGRRRYFIGFENEAESRGLGGIPGAFAIATVDNGTFHFTHFGNDNDLQHVRANLRMPSDFMQRYGSADPTGVFQNSDISPDFRDAARIWAAMWTQKTGQHIDGAIAIDPTAISYLLRVTGPAPLVHGGGAVTADNVVALTQQVQYAKYADVTERKRYVVDIARAVSQKLTTGAANMVDFLHAAARGGNERRIVLWSADPGEENELVAAGYAGALPSADGGAITGFTTVNAAGGKLDYYLGRSMNYQRSTCNAGATATATFSLRNTAPRSGLPAYVTLRADKPTFRTVPGDNRLIVTYFGTPGAHVITVMVNGRPVPFTSGSERGLVTASIDLELPVQQTRTIEVRLTEPAATAATTPFVQPGVRAVPLQMSGHLCG